jgi:hypothetical protein
VSFPHERVLRFNDLLGEPTTAHVAGGDLGQNRVDDLGDAEFPACAQSFPGKRLSPGRSVADRVIQPGTPGASQFRDRQESNEPLAARTLEARMAQLRLRATTLEHNFNFEGQPF